MKNSRLEGKHQVAGWDRKESTPCHLHRLHKGLQIEISILYDFIRTTESFEDSVEPTDEAINDIFLPVLFRQRDLPPAQGGLGIPDLKAEVSQQYAASNVIIVPHVAARLAKINNAGQRQWCELVAPRRSPWKAGPDIELATISGLAMLALQSATGRLAEPLRVWRSIHGQPRPVV